MLNSFSQFMSAPTSCQFAKGGLWESAWSFSIDRLPSHPELATYLAHSTEVAFEVFFGHTFFGARMLGSALEVESFGIKCLQAVRARESFFTVFQREIGCPVAGQQPAFAELGCVNAWRSVGATRISGPQLGLAGFEQLWRTVPGSAVGRDTRHAKAVEFAFESPLPHWFGIPVSPADGSNQVSRHLLHQAIELVMPR